MLRIVRRPGLPLSALRIRPFGSGIRTAEWSKPLSASDPELFDLIQLEAQRQAHGLELIASENFCSQGVREAMGSILTNKYSEGYPGARYYGGNQYIDKIELLAQTRALQAFSLSAEEWGVNVQSLSGSPANIQAYSAVLAPHDRLMGLDLPHGGHLTHGFMTAKKRISASSVFFESMPYRLDEKTGRIDYAGLQHSANLFLPKLIVAGASAYPRLYDYAKMREIADSVGAYLMSDIAHIAGLIAANVIPSPFPFSDIVTTTTHKSLRGPRAALIFYRKGQRERERDGKKETVAYDLEERVNFSVFPMHQGGPHNHAIAAVATALHEALQPSFRVYQQTVLDNAQALASALSKLKFQLVSNGTDNHLILLNVFLSHGIDGARVDSVLEQVHITANKNSIAGDKKPMVPGGVRLGTPALTSRGFLPKHMEKVAEFISRGADIAVRANKVGENSKKLSAFQAYVRSKDREDIRALGNEVQAFSTQFPMP